jgi:hypothetical protein
MGYDVHITRREHWCDRGEPSISLEEWSALVANDAEMRMDGFAEAPVDGGVLRVVSPGLAVWTAYSGHGKNRNMAWFSWSNGEVLVKNPDIEILRKMYAIAQSLSAHLYGDDDETYGADGNPKTAAKPWWRLW